MFLYTIVGMLLFRSQFRLICLAATLCIHLSDLLAEKSPQSPAKLLHMEDLLIQIYQADQSMDQKYSKEQESDSSSLIIAYPDLVFHLFSGLASNNRGSLMQLRKLY